MRERARVRESARVCVRERMFGYRQIAYVQSALLLQAHSVAAGMHVCIFVHVFVYKSVRV